MIAVRHLAREHHALALFTVGYLAGFLVYGIAIGSDVAIPYALLIIGLVFLAVDLERRFALGAGLLWCLAIWGAAHMAGGVVPFSGGRTLYNVWLLPSHLLRYDQAVHAFGFGAATVACGVVLRTWLPPGLLHAGPAVLIVLAGLGVGAVNEIVEFFATLAMPNTNVGGYQNTGLPPRRGPRRCHRRRGLARPPLEARATSQLSWAMRSSALDAGAWHA